MDPGMDKDGAGEGCGQIASQPGRCGADRDRANAAIPLGGDLLSGILDLDVHGLRTTQQHRSKRRQHNPRR
jgi:hypothetical protein